MENLIGATAQQTCIVLYYIYMQVITLELLSSPVQSY